MNMKQLITFTTLAQEKHYIKVSERLNYAPSTLAKHIRSLEGELQTQLFEYRRGKLDLTEDGRRFLPYAEEMLQIYARIHGEFGPKDPAKGCIRVAGGELMVGFAYGNFFGEIEKVDGKAAVQVNAICCARVPQWLSENEVDIGFVQVLDPKSDGEQEVVGLFEETLCLMASPEHPLASRSEVRLADLHQQNFSYTYEDCCFTDEFRRRLQLSGAQPASELFLGSIYAVINTAKEDKRLCLIPYVCVPKVQQMGLVKLGWVDSFQIYDVILLQKGAYHSSTTHALVRGAKEYAARLKNQKETENIRLL